MTLTEIIKAGGGIVKLSRALGFKSHQALYKWKRVPAERVVHVEKFTGIPRELLRPDLYIRAASFQTVNDQKETGQ